MQNGTQCVGARFHNSKPRERYERPTIRVAGPLPASDIREKSSAPRWADSGGSRSRLFALEELRISSDEQVERQAIKDAIRLLSVLRNEILKSTITIEAEQRLCTYRKSRDLIRKMSELPGLTTREFSSRESACASESRLLDLRGNTESYLRREKSPISVYSQPHSNPCQQMT